MKLEREVEFVFDNESYITLETMDYDNVNYAFVNRLSTADGEPTEEFYVYKNDGNLERVVDTDLLNVLLPKFQEQLQKLIIELAKE